MPNPLNTESTRKTCKKGTIFFCETQNDNDDNID